MQQQKRRYMQKKKKLKEIETCKAVKLAYDLFLVEMFNMFCTNSYLIQLDQIDFLGVIFIGDKQISSWSEFILFIYIFFLFSF